MICWLLLSAIPQKKQSEVILDDETVRNLIIEEYKNCRELIKINIEIIEKNEIYATGAAAAVAVFCISSTNKTVVQFSCWLPLIIAMLGAIRFYGVDIAIRQLNNYIVEIEGRYRQLGWTTSYRKQNRYKILKFTRLLYWLVLCSCSGAFALYLFLSGPIAATSESQKVEIIKFPSDFTVTKID